MRSARLVISVVAAAALVPLTAGTAFAAPPGNDKPGGAIAVSLGDTIKEDTSKATTDGTDSEANQACGAPFTNASVWFTYTAADDGSFILNMAKSNYTGGFMIFDGAPSSQTLINCGPTKIGQQSVAGTTYTIMAFSDTEVNGGKLVMSVQEGPPPPTVAVTVDPTGIAYPNGNARVTGTFTCSDATFVDNEGTLQQIWKRVKITGFFSKFLRRTDCDGQEHAWKKVVVSENGLYANGAASVFVDSFACGRIFCTEVQTTQDVTLHVRGGQAASTPRLRSGNHTDLSRASQPSLWQRNADFLNR